MPPWTHDGDSYGFAGRAWLQPAGFSRTAVSAQSGQDGSTLELYRDALRMRRQLQTVERLEWLPVDDADAAFRTPRWLALHQQLQHRTGRPARGRGSG